MEKSSAPKTKEERDLRRAEVKDMMETLGPFSVPAKVLAEKHNVAPTIIYNDINFWIKKIDVKRMGLEGRKIIMSLRKNLSITEELKVKGTHTEKIRAIQASNQTAEVLTKMMEQYGFKEKIADKLNVQGDLPITFNLIEKSVEEIKSEKLNRNKSNDKPKADGNI